MNLSLNGNWYYKADPYNVGVGNSWYRNDWIKPHIDLLDKISLPNNWNIIPDLERYEGIVWFYYSLDKITAIGKSPESMIYSLNSKQ